MTIETLKASAESIEKKQNLSVRQKADEGNVRAIEILWISLVQKYHSHRPASFTGMERQAIRNLVSGYGIHNLLLYLTETIRTWSVLKSAKQFSSFPQVPTFQIFLRFHRIITPLISIAKVRQMEEQEKLAAKEREEKEKKDYRPPKSLTEMVKDYRKKS